MEWSGRLRWQVATRWFRPARPRLSLAPLSAEGFPVYPLIWHPCRTRRTRETDPAGRMIGVEYSFDYQPSEAAFQAELGPNDVVWVPLYTGTIDTPPTTRDLPRREFDANQAALATLGPRVRALLVGNANGEIHYDLPRAQEWQKAIVFVEEHGARIRAHGRPAFAPIFELLLHDCYVGEGRLRDALNAVDALVLSFAGCTWLFEKERPRIPEPHPYPILSAYLHTLTAWSGVGMQRGLDAGSGPVLASLGYRGGFMGYY